MSALDSQRALLDSLMGAHRNRDEDDPVAKKTHWKDDDVCKHYLCGFCPHDLFVGTKSDIGPCDKIIHSDELRKDFQEQKSSRKWRYEQRFLVFLQDLIRKLERRIQRGRTRLSLDVDGEENEENFSREQRDRLEEIDTMVEDYTEKMEILGCQGKVQEAHALLMKVEKLKNERATIATTKSMSLLPNSDGKKMTVCEICGAFLVMNDIEVRVDAHLRGKTHQGFKMVREKIDEILQNQATRKTRSRSRSRSRSRRRRRR